MRLQSMRVQTALSAAVYKKALVLSATGRKDYTSGTQFDKFELQVAELPTAGSNLESQM